MKKQVFIVFAKAVLLCCCLTAGNVMFGQNNDTAGMRVRTLGVSVLGTAFGGVGITYDHSFAGAEKSYWYWRGAVSCMINDLDLFPLAGGGYCRSVSKNKKFVVGAGLNTGVLIARDPTPKELRDYWDSVGFYGGNYVYPLTWIIVPELSVGYFGRRWFSKLQFTPIIPYEKFGRNEFNFIPWAGITAGFRFR